MRFFALLLASLLCLVGCADDPKDTSCSTDDDCGEGLVCAPLGCVPARADTIPEITSFSASTDTVEPGGSVTISWAIAAGDSATLTWGDQSLDIARTDFNGDTLVVLEETTEFTLSVTGTNDTITETLTVNVEAEAPVIDSFEFQRDRVPAGGSARLDWTMRNVVSARIYMDDVLLHIVPEEDLEVGEWRYTAQTTSTLTLEAEGAFGDMVSADATITTVGGEPEIALFGASRTAIVAGEDVTLEWETLNADAIEITDSDGNSVTTSDMANGSIVVTPSGDTTYRLTATNQNGSEFDTIDIEVFEPVVISEFSATPGSVGVGGAVNLAWTVTGDVSSMSLQDPDGALIDIGGIVLDSSIIVRPTASGTYTLRAGNTAQSVQSTVDVVVVPGAPVISTFEATPNPVPSGQNSLLRWVVSGATSLALEDRTAMQTLDISALDVSQDTFLVTPTTDTVYRLTATNPGGSTFLDITLGIQLPVQLLSFSVDQTQVVAGTDVTFSWETANATTIELITGSGTQYNLISRNVDQDSLTITVTNSESFTFTANGYQGPVSDTVVVTAYDPPTVLEFSASSELIRLGDNVTLTWTASGSQTTTLTDDQGNTYDIASLDPNDDSVTFSPTESATYTLSVDNLAGTTTSTVTVTTVDVDSLRISEVFFDAVGSDDGLEWVELHNAGDTTIDLQYFSLGSGGSDLATSTAQLTGLVPPGGCFVVGGPTPTAGNGNPTFDQAIDFNPDLQNGPDDGIALFFAPDTDIDASVVPEDSVIWGGTNVSGFLGETGVADTEIAPDPANGNSLERTSISDVFRVQSTPTPNNCQHLTTITPSRTTNQSTGTIEIRGWGLDADYDTVQLGTQTLTCANTFGGIDCAFAATADSGAVDLLITRGSASQTRVSAVLLEAELADPGVDYWCGVETPGTTSASAGQPIDVSVQVYLVAATEAGGQLPLGWIVEAAFFTSGADPAALFSHPWVAAAKTGNTGNNAIYSASLTSSTAQTAEAAFRVSPDGVNFYYCDTISNGGSDDGYSSGLSLTWN